MRVFNFSAGPAGLPEPVLLQAQEEMLDWNNLGASVVEISHRSNEFIELAAETEANLRQLLSIPESYAVLFLSGGATTQQALFPLNFANSQQSIDYVITGHWGKTAVKQAQVYNPVNIVASSENNGFTSIPDENLWEVNPNSAYLHITANETIHGVEFRKPLNIDNNKIPVIADFSSSIASEFIDINDYGIIYAGAQKNLGPVGISVVIIRRDLLERQGQARADIFDYRSHYAKDSMLNTPPTWNWYMLGLTLKWMLNEGGVNEFARRNQKKSDAIYKVIDHSNGFYRNPVDISARSRMNIPFFLPNEELTQKFVAESKQNRLMGLKGHKVVGGIRASLYNAMPLEGALALADFMQYFQQQYAGK